MRTLNQTLSLLLHREVGRFRTCNQLANRGNNKKKILGLNIASYFTTLLLHVVVSRLDRLLVGLATRRLFVFVDKLGSCLSLYSSSSDIMKRAVKGVH